MSKLLTRVIHRFKSKTREIEKKPIHKVKIDPDRLILTIKEEKKELSTEFIETINCILERNIKIEQSNQYTSIERRLLFESKLLEEVRDKWSIYIQMSSNQQKEYRNTIKERLEEIKKICQNF